MKSSSRDIKSKEYFVISEYINNPLLLNDKKFDIRSYVLVTNFNPLEVWVYEKGFARVCSEDYIKLEKDLNPNNNLYKHLTNVSFQKYSDKYNNQHGGKYPLNCLFLHIEINYGFQKMIKLKQEIYALYLSSLKSVQ